MAIPTETAGRLPSGRLELESLDPEDLRALAYASALGAEFDFDLLADALESESERLSERFERFVQLGALKERPGGDRFTFVDDAFRAQIYQSLTESRLRVIHGRIAQALERRNPRPTPEIVAELGRHYFLGKRPEKAWKYNRDAGRNARAAYRLDAAVHHLERARRDLRALPANHAVELAQLDEELGDLQRMLGRFEAADGAYVQALGLTNPDERLARSRLLISRAKLAWTSGQIELTKQLSDEAFGLAEHEHDRRMIAEVHRLRSRLAGQAGNYALQLDEAMVALDLLQRSDDRVALGDCCTDIAIAFTNLGPEVQEDARLWYRRAVEILSETPDQLGTVRALANLALSVGRTDPMGALEHLLRARELAEKISAQRWVLRTLLLGTEYLLALGQPEEAEKNHRLAIRLLERYGDPRTHVGEALSRGMIAERRGAWEDAEQAFREAEESARNQSLRSESAEAVFRLARLYYKTRNIAAAQEAFRSAARQELPRLRPELAGAYEELARSLREAGPTPPTVVPSAGGGGGYKSLRAPR